MEQIKTKVRRWGHSFGVVIPKKVIEGQNLNEGSDVTIIVEKKGITTVGDLMQWAKNHPIKLQKSTDELLKEIDQEFWPKDT